MIHLKLFEEVKNKKPKVLLFQGSPRDKDSCAGMDSKTSTIIEYITDKYSDEFNFEVIDLSVNTEKKSIIQPCKGCVSTAGGYHCHWYCDCYSKDNKDAPDFMHDADIYIKLQKCDAFLVFSPIHWYSVSSQVKAMFDRLVCANQTLDYNDAIDILGKSNLKNPEITSIFAKSGEHNDLLKNHLEGKIAGFYVHGDNGANDYEDNPLPKTFKGDDDFTAKQAVMPLVYQCRYSGIKVPDNLVVAFSMNEGVNYFTANVNMDKIELPYKNADKLIQNLKKQL